MSADKCYLIIPASGIGSRMNSIIPKQYIALDNGLTVIDQTLKTFLEVDSINGCIVAISNNDSEFKSSLFSSHPKMLAIATGGKERIHSVMSSLEKLKFIANESDWVLVHDAVRPCIKTSDIEKLIYELKNNDTGGLLGIRITDTVKQTNNVNFVEKTIDRSNLWQACTPQMYRFGVLFKALGKAIKDNFNATDEASAIEHSSLKSQMVQCSKSNIKITTPEDIELANYYLKQGLD